VSTAEPATPAAIPSLKRLGASLGTTGLVSGRIRAEDPCRISPGTFPGCIQCHIALQVKLGGLGILSFKICAPFPYAPASEADTLISPLLDQDTDTTNQTVLSQRERCQEAFLATRDSLLESLDPQSAKSVIEASFLLRKKWLSVIPFFPALRLTDFEVSAALHARTLLPGGTTHCRHCGA
jgi:hypothetical protein